VRRALRVYLTVQVRYGVSVERCQPLVQGKGVQREVEPAYGQVGLKEAGGKFDYVDFQFRSEKHEDHQAQVVGQVCKTKQNSRN